MLTQSDLNAKRRESDVAYLPTNERSSLEGSASSGKLVLKEAYLKSLPLLTLATYFDIHKIAHLREVNAAVINISGRQRMLSQRIALFALRLIYTNNLEEQNQLRSQLLEMVNLMETSHSGLIEGNQERKLPGYLSPTMRAIYFEAPHYLDQQVRQFIEAGKAIAQVSPENLASDNSHLQYLLNVSADKLLHALDQAVSQYQQEKEEQEREIDFYQAQLYQQSCEATEKAKAQAKQLKDVINQLKTAQIQLVQAEKMSSLGQLVAGIAHEINNPLNFIHGNLIHARTYLDDLFGLVTLYQTEQPQLSDAIAEEIDRIDLDFLKEDLPRLLNSMQLGTERIQEIVLSLRNFSRLDEMGLKEVDIHEGIESTLLILHHRFKPHGSESGIIVNKNYGNLPLVQCYPVQLNQVFMNLVANAIDAIEMRREETSSFEGLISVQTEVIRNNWIAIRIKDNGCGITPQVQKHLFDPFFTTKPIGKGTGLGLSISYQIIKKNHQGNIVCCSTPEQGTEFVIEIPIKQVI